MFFHRIENATRAFDDTMGNRFTCCSSPVMVKILSNPDAVVVAGEIIEQAIDRRWKKRPSLRGPVVLSSPSDVPLGLRGLVESPAGGLHLAAAWAMDRLFQRCAWRRPAHVMPLLAAGSRRGRQPDWFGGPLSAVHSLALGAFGTGSAWPSLGCRGASGLMSMRSERGSAAVLMEEA